MTSARTSLALSMAEQIAGEASGMPPAWTGADVVGDEQSWHIAEGPVDQGLYTGATGIALALAASHRCGAASPVAEVGLAAASEALDHGHGLLAEGATDMASGSSGIAYGVAWVGRLLGRPDLEEDARVLAAATTEQVRSGTDRVDLLTGAAGALLASLAVAADDSHVIAAAVDVADWIASQATPHAWGVAWAEPGTARPDLLGLAHGTSGIAVALAEASSLAGGGHLWEWVEQALAYERSWFEPDLPGWPDLRSVHSEQGGISTTGDAAIVGEPSWPVAWCHGAVGIGLARLRLVSGTDAGEQLPGGRQLLLAEAGAAIEAARQRLRVSRARLRDGEVEDCCLCHGLAGAVDLLVAAAGLPGGEDHLRAARRSADILLAQHAAGSGWPCGLPRPDPRAPDGQHEERSERRQSPPSGPSPQPPGLFLGRAGILLTLLRSDHPDVVPAVTLPQRLPSTD